MAKKRRAIVTLFILFSLPVAAARSEVALKFVQTIPLPEVDGRIDHFAIDVKGRRVFLAALAKNTVEVVDLRAGSVTQSLAGFAKPQGVLFVPKFNRLLVASGADGSVKTLDGTTLAVIQTASVSLGADAIGYDPRSNEIYVGSGGGDANKERGDLTIFNVADGAQVTALVQLVKWTIPGIQKNVAIALDEKSQRLFLGVRTPARVWYAKRDRLYIAAPPSGVLGARLLVFEAQTE